MSNTLMRYIYGFILGAIGGIISETIISRGKNHCIILPRRDCILPVTLANLYGWSAVILIIIFDSFKRKLNFYSLSVSLFAILIFECIAGKISYRYHGYQTWKYEQNWYPLCQNYVSLKSSIYFALLIIIFYYIIYKGLT